MFRAFYYLFLTVENPDSTLPTKYVTHIFVFLKF